MKIKKVKIFKSSIGFNSLESNINDWLSSLNKDTEIISLSYQDNNKYASVIILYEEN